MAPEMVTDPSKLAALGLWSEEVYRDLLDVERGLLGADAFRARYVRRRAVVEIDSVGLTDSSLRLGEVAAFCRILRFQQVCVPLLYGCGAELVAAFADNLTAIFECPMSALNAAFAVHRGLGGDGVPRCGIGIGFGELFAIGPNLAMGNEMNLASKLGEDTAGAGETLLTPAAFDAVRGHDGASFCSVVGSRLGFAYVRAVEL